MIVENPAVGILYIKNAVENPEKIIEDLEDMEFFLQQNPNIMTQAELWHRWDDSEGKLFCWQKFFPDSDKINKNDFLYEKIFSLSSRMSDPVKKHLETYFNHYPLARNNIKKHEGSISVLKYVDGGFLANHQDHGVSSRTLSSVTYLNDNYEGGEITFETFKLSIKPEAGSIIFFPSNFIYGHQVNSVKGTRYALPNWFHNVDVPYQSDGRE